MQYDLSNEYQLQSFLSRVQTLMDKGAVVEMTEKAFRTRSQNSYLHLLIGVVAMETGNTLDYCKEWYYKRQVNPDLFLVKTKDKLVGDVTTLRSSSELTKEEMSVSIDRFKRWGSEMGFYMPNPGDESLLKAIAIEMGRMRNYIGG